MTSHDADAWGIVNGFYDTLGNHHVTSGEQRAALLEAMRVGAGDPEPDARVRVVRHGTETALATPGRLVLEDGTAYDIGHSTPADLPVGYHTFTAHDRDVPEWLFVTPGACHFEETLRAWGWGVQLYALRSNRSWGLGDFADLKRLGEWGAAQGASFVQINPVYAATPVAPLQRSPYSPTSRLFRSLLYLDIDAVAGALDLDHRIEQLREAARALNVGRLIEHDAVFRLKMSALELFWPRFGGSDAFDRYCREQGELLRLFALFCVLAEVHGRSWHDWPEEYRHPQSPAVQRFAEEQRDRLRFHMWVQWLLDDQLAEVARTIPLMQDLPIGFDPDGADAWVWQELLAFDARVGAPPDDFNPLGQDWGLPPFIPHKLRACGYAPIIQTLRATMRHSGILRIDHVMGLWRLYWITRSGGPGAGSYVRYPYEEQLAIVAIESHRQKTVVVGEDLGTVEDSVRERLAEQSMPSYKLLWFEDRPPSQYPKHSLAGVTTHDLPTIAGVWMGEEREARIRVGLAPNEEGLNHMRARLRDAAGLPDDAALEDVIVRTHAAISRSPAALVAATLEDALGVHEPPNRPGLTSHWPNWSLALPYSLDDLIVHPLAQSVAQALRRTPPSD
jgi:4-alpha-glucanotransferase